MVYSTQVDGDCLVIGGISRHCRKGYCLLWLLNVIISRKWRYFAVANSESGRIELGKYSSEEQLNLSI